jgi:hypothetical protein
MPLPWLRTLLNRTSRPARRAPRWPALEALELRTVPSGLDFGDAPDPTYPTLLAHDGARHTITGLTLGTRIDAEPDGQPNATATGDDASGSGTGAYTVSTPAFNFQDISDSGTPLFLGDDQVTGPLPIGFTFNFFGTDYTTLNLSSNGFLNFTGDFNSGCCSGQPLPTPGSPDGIIAGWWDDLYPPGGGSITYQTLGSPGSRVFIAEFKNVPEFGAPNALSTFEFKLFEGTNDIEVHYPNVQSNGNTHAAGIENQTGTVGNQFFLGTGSLPANTAVRYSLTAASDEDGVTLPAAFAANGTAAIQVTVNGAISSPAKLDAWIDWNHNGSWNDPGEEIAVDTTVFNGNNTLIVPVPAAAAVTAPTTTFARFRLSTAGGLAPTGLAADGEVEDYAVTLNSPSTVYINPAFTGPVGSDPDGSGPATAIGYDAFATIPQGVSVVTAGGTVDVEAGTYSGGVVLNKSVTVQAFGGGTATVTTGDFGDGSSGAFEVKADNVTVNGLNLDGSESPNNQFGVLVSHGLSGAAVTNNTVGCYQIGVQVQGTARLLNNTITENGVGLDVNGGTALVQGNDLSDNTVGVGATGLRAENGAIVDAGQLSGAASYYGNITGLGVSTGGNTFSGYTFDASGTNPSVPQAIRDLNTGTAPFSAMGVEQSNNYSAAGPQLGRLDLTAQGNVFNGNPSLPLFQVEQLIFHDLDNPAYGFVTYGTSAAAAPVVVGNVQYDASATGPAASNGFGTLVAGAQAAGPQKSLIRNIVVTYSSFVFLDPNANRGLNLVKLNGPYGAPTNTQVHVGVASAVYNQSNGNYTVIYSFSGPGTEFGSLEDGNYSLRFNEGGIQGGGPGGPGLSPAGDPYAAQAAQFFRLFGDVNGDHQVDGTDLAAFQAAYRSRQGMANYRAYFDFESNGLIDSQDYYQFQRRYKTRLNADGSLTALP